MLLHNVNVRGGRVYEYKKGTRVGQLVFVKHCAPCGGGEHVVKEEPQFEHKGFGSTDEGEL